MASVSPDCSYLYNDSILPPSLQANPDISGIGVLVGFVGMAYITLLMLVMRYIMGLPEETSLDDKISTNPIDKIFLGFIWRKLGKLPDHLGPVLKSTILGLSDVQIVTGLSILASGYSQFNHGLSVFHWQIVVYLAWFSSATHLTTLTFLRRFIHKNHGIRTLRLVLMLVLVLMLAVALVPTGGACGMQNAGQAGATYIPENNTIFNASGLEKVYPGSLAKCCFELMSSGQFVGPDKSDFLAMVASELVLISSSATRAIKVFRGTSTSMKELLRHRPARAWKRLILRLEKQHTTSTVTPLRFILFVLHSSHIILIIFARATYDVAESLLFEISWLAFSLAWGTLQMFNVRGLADSNLVTTDDSQQQVALQENFWGFGQWAPTLLLILPLLSLAESWLDGSDESAEKSSVTSGTTDHLTVQGNNASATTLEDLDSNTPLSTVQALCGLPGYIDPYSELDRSIDISVMQRTGTDLVNMEQRIGNCASNESTSGTVEQGQTISSKEEPRNPELRSPLWSAQALWPAQKFYDHDFYADDWYKDMIIFMYLVVLTLGFTFMIFTAGVGSKSILAFVDIFTNVTIYSSLPLLFAYGAICISIERRPDLVPLLSPPKHRIVPTLRRSLLLGIILMCSNWSSYSYFVGIVLAGSALVFSVSLLHHRFWRRK